MIAKQDWERLLADTAAKLSGASMQEIKSTIFDTLHEFFKDSSSWIESVSLPVVAGTTTYTVAVTEGQIIRLAGVVDANNLPVKALMPDLGVITLAFPTNQTATYSAFLVKNVTLPLSKGMQPVGPEWVLPLWGPYISEGVVGKMMNTPQRTYSDVKGALYRLQRFRDAIQQARTETLSRYTIGGASWRYPQDFQARGQKGGISTGFDTRFESWP